MKILITADWHIKGERPICRLDENWIESQREMIAAIREVYEKTGCEQMWILGDLFDAPKCATSAVNMLIEELQKFPKDSVKVLCGNHDLKDHNYGNLEECSIGTIKHLFADVPAELSSVSVAGGLLKVSANPFGMDDEESSADIICTHQLTFPNEKARPMADCGVLAQDLLDKWRAAKIIFTGDYHHAFIHEEIKPGDFVDRVTTGRFVVNPGCINIQKADELDYIPGVYVWDTSRSVDVAFQRWNLNPQRENCTRDHIEARESKETMLSEVVETIKGGAEITLDFDSNLEQQVNRTSSAIIDEYSIMREEMNGEAK